MSKLLLLYGVRTLAQLSPLTPESDVLITYLTPGACKSDIFRDQTNWFTALLMNIVTALIARSTEAGSCALVHGVSPELGPEAHGAFLMDCKVAPYVASIFSSTLCSFSLVDGDSQLTVSIETGRTWRVRKMRYCRKGSGRSSSLSWSRSHPALRQCEKSRESGHSGGRVDSLLAHCILRDLKNFVCWGMYLLLLRRSGDCRSILVDVVAEEHCKHT